VKAVVVWKERGLAVQMRLKRVVMNSFPTRPFDSCKIVVETQGWLARASSHDIKGGFVLGKEQVMMVVWEKEGLFTRGSSKEHQSRAIRRAQ
jgi:hypothetical protein